MNIAIYYCHSCGNRLQKDEADVSLARGESFSTACCEKCAQAGKRIKDPKAVEQAKLEVRPSTASAENPISSDSAEISAVHLPVAATRTQTPPRGTRTSATSVLKRPTATVPERRNERTPAKGLPVIPIAAAAVVIIGFVAFLATRGDKPEAIAEKPPVKNETPEVSRTNPPNEKPQTVEVIRPVTTVSVPTQQPVAGAQERPVNPVLTAGNTEHSTELIESHLRYKSFTRAKEALDSLEKSVPADEKNAAVKAKIATLREDCQKASQAALNDLLKVAEGKANAGDVAGVKLVLGPQRLMDLLPEHAEAAQKSVDSYVEKAQIAAKAEEERKVAEAAAQRNSFEARLPGEGTLPAPADNVLVLFGPGFQKNLKQGKDTIQAPAGKLPYSDVSKKIELNNAGGMLYSAGVIVEYSATEPIQCVVSVNAKDAGWVSGSTTLPAGEMRTETIKLAKDFITKGKRGDWNGRSISDVKLEIKNPKPGTLGVFRISITK